MTTAISAILNVITAISDYGNVVYSKLVYYISISGVLIGTGINLGTGGGGINHAASNGLTLQECGAIVAIVSGLMLILKTGVDIWLRVSNHIEARREKKYARETSLNGDQDV